MARARKRGDDATNARKRYYRSAQRNLAKAEASSGANAAKYRAIAKRDFENALNTYDASAPKQKFSKPIRELADKFGVDLEGRRSEFVTRTGKSREKAISQSKFALESALTDESVRREREAVQLINNPKIGSRIIGGFVDIWRDKFLDDEGDFDKERIMPVLMDYFHVSTIADMLDKVEKMVGDILYLDEDSATIYETVKILIQMNVADNSITV